MTEQEFLDKVSESGIGVYVKAKDRNDRPVVSYKDKRKSGLAMTDYLRVSWMSGGVGGGSCWNDGSGPDPHYAIEGDPEPDFEDLENVLVAVCPNIGFLAFKKVMREANIETGSETEYEYYGNSTTYSYKQVQLGNLYKALKGSGLI